MSVDGQIIGTLPHYDAGPTNLVNAQQKDTSHPGSDGCELPREQTYNETRDDAARRVIPNAAEAVKIAGYVHNDCDAAAMYCPQCEYMGYSPIKLANCPNCFKKGSMVVF